MSQFAHSRLVSGAFGLLLEITADGWKRCASCDEQDCSPACKQLQRLQPQRQLASSVTGQQKPRRARSDDGCEMTSAVLGTRLDRGGARSWWKVTWEEATISPLVIDSSVHRVRVCKDMEKLTNDNEVSAFGDTCEVPGHADERHSV